MQQFNFTSSLVATLTLAACGDGNAPSITDDSEEPAERGSEQQGKQVAQSVPEAKPASGECGEGGTECPDGLECLTWRNGEQVCSPMPGPGSVLVKDATLGGACISPKPADPIPGTSIASVQVVRVDIEARSDMHGPDRVGGTINFFEPR